MISVSGPKYYLGEGKYTIRDQKVKDAASYVLQRYYKDFVRKGTPDYEARSEAVIKFLNEKFNLKKHDTSWEERTASDMLNSVNYGNNFHKTDLYNCIDSGILANAILREMGTPSKFVVAAKVRKNKTIFHIFVENLSENGKWFLTDSYRGGFQIIEPLAGQSKTSSRQFYKILEGLDPSELHVPGNEEAARINDLQDLREVTFSLLPR